MDSPNDKGNISPGSVAGIGDEAGENSPQTNAFAEGLASSTAVAQSKRGSNNSARHDEIGDRRLSIAEELELCRQKQEVLKLELELARTNLLLLQQRGEQAAGSAVFMSATASDSRDSRSLAHNVRELIAIAPIFDPSNKTRLSSVQWVRRIQEMQEIYQLEDKTILLLASSRLEGAAKFWLQGNQSKVTSWDQMKTHIALAFPVINDESEVHITLSRRKKKADESFETYFFEIISIANRISLSDGAKVRYLINGLGDSKL